MGSKFHANLYSVITGQKKSPQLHCRCVLKILMTFQYLILYHGAPYVVLFPLHLRAVTGSVTGKSDVPWTSTGRLKTGGKSFEILRSFYINREKPRPNFITDCASLYSTMAKRQTDGQTWRMFWTESPFSFFGLLESDWRLSLAFCCCHASKKPRGWSSSPPAKPASMVEKCISP